MDHPYRFPISVNCVYQLGYRPPWLLISGVNEQFESPPFPKLSFVPLDLDGYVSFDPPSRHNLETFCLKIGISLIAEKVARCPK